MLFSHTIVLNSLWPHGLQHTSTPCPSPSLGVCPSSGSLHRWCHPAISSSDTLFSCPQSFPASGAFPMSHLFTSDEIFFLSLCLFTPEIKDSWVLSSLIGCVVKTVFWHMQESWYFGDFLKRETHQGRIWWQAYGMAFLSLRSLLKI